MAGLIVEFRLFDLLKDYKIRTSVNVLNRYAMMILIYVLRSVRVCGIFWHTQSLIIAQMIIICRWIIL